MDFYKTLQATNICTGIVLSPTLINNGQDQGITIMLHNNAYIPNFIP